MWEFQNLLFLKILTEEASTIRGSTDARPIVFIIGRGHELLFYHGRMYQFIIFRGKIEAINAKFKQSRRRHELIKACGKNLENRINEAWHISFYNGQESPIFTSF